MKRSFHRTAPLKFTSLLFATSTLLSIAPAQAAPLKEARVTQVINDVKILPGQAAAKPAVVNDEVREGTAVRTGTESRTELTFGDLSIARLGANTIFSFDQGSRSVELGGGAILLRVPKDSGGGKIKTAAVTAAITGTTVMAEFNCEDQSLNRIQSRCPDANFKFIVLEGSMRVCKTANPRDCVDLGAGQMLAGSIDRPLGDPIDIDLSRLLATSLLIQGFPPLGSEDEMAAAIAAQGGLLDIGYLGEGTALSNVDVRDQRTAALPMHSPSPGPTASPTPAPTPTPSPSASPTPAPTASPSPTVQPTPQKFGTPPVITSSVPYIIASSTVIVTDPTITTNGVTDEGRIYRSSAEDGPASAYLFTATRPFDTTSSFDQYFGSGAEVPMAAFKFLALHLAGDPTISTANGGPPNLALISVGDLTTGAGGLLTFAGIERLLLATQNGSITLGSGVSFQLPSMYVYARGATADLTLDTTFSGTRGLYFVAERNILATGSLVINQINNGQTDNLNISLFAGNAINIGGDLRLTTDASNVQTGANLLIRSGGNMTVGGMFELNVIADSDSTMGTGGDIFVTTGSLTAGSIDFDAALDALQGLGTGGNIRVDVHGNLTTTQGGITLQLSTPVASSTATLSEGGNLTLMVNGSLSTPVGSELTLSLVNTNGSTVLNGANILVSVGGNLTTGTLTLESSNAGFGATNTGSNMTLTVGGDVNLDSFLAQLDNTDSGRIGTGGNISASIGGNLSVQTATLLIDNSDGAITTGGNISLNVDGRVSAPGGITLRVANIAGSIATGGNISAAFDGMTNAQFIIAEVINSSGSIGNGGNITLDIAGDLIFTDFLSATVDNGADIHQQNVNGTAIGGTINTGGNLSLSVGGDVSAPPGLTLQVINTDGTIGQGGNISLTVGGFVDTEAFSLRINNAGGDIGTGGNITASIGENLEAFTINSIIDSRSGGSIDNGGIMDIRVGGNMITTFGGGFAPAGTQGFGDANFQIFVNPPIGDGGIEEISGPAILVRAANFNIAGSLHAFIDDSGGTGAPTTQAGTVLITASNALTVGSRLNVLGTVNAITVNAGTLAATLVNATRINAGSGGIRQFELPSNGSRVDVTHVLNAGTIVSPGGINFDGYPAVGDVTFATNGGRLTLNTNFLTFGTDNPNISGSVTLNGGNSSTAFGAGDGGELTVNATGAIFVGLDIEATSGFVQSNLGPSGRGGSVTLASSQNIVDIDARIEVSSADPAPPEPPTPPRRRSVQGGNIAIRSGRVGPPTSPTGLPRTVAVNISNSSQLLALLDAAAPPAPGGKITILATGANSDVNVNGRLGASRGTIDIRHEADNGRVNIGNASGVESRTIMSADVIKARAFGANGQLNIGHTSMAGENLIRLYAQGSNGQLNFVANTTLSGNNRIDLAASTITIQPNVIVTITGDAGPAHVYTNNPNYSGFGGTNPANGTFGGNGANTPQPLVNAPPFDDPPPMPGGH